MFDKFKKIINKPFSAKEEKIKEEQIVVRKQEVAKEEEFSVSEYIETKQKELISQPIEQKELVIKNRYAESLFSVSLLLSLFSIIVYFINDVTGILLCIISICLYVFASSTLVNEAYQYKKLKEIRASHNLLNRSFTLFKTNIFFWSLSVSLLFTSLYKSIYNIFPNLHEYNLESWSIHLICYGISLFLFLIIFTIYTIKRKKFNVI